MERSRQRIDGTVLMRRIAERLAGAPGVERGLSGVVPLLSRFLDADFGLFLVRGNDGWTVAGDGGHDAIHHALPRTPRLSLRAEHVALSDIAGNAAVEGRFDGAGGPDSVVVPVRAGRRSHGYGIFRTGADRLPSAGTLRLLDAVGAQVAAFCECVSRGGRGNAGGEPVERLVRSNRDLGWLLRFNESLHAHGDPDAMFQWLGQELDYLAPVSSLELVTLPEGPVVRVGSGGVPKTMERRDGAAVAREWAETLASRYRIRVPERDFRIQRFACLPAAEGRYSAAPETRRKEAPLCHGGQLLGVLAVGLRAGSGDGSRVDALVESAAGQVALFLHKHAEREKIRFLANHDALTGLLNQLSFRNIYEREFERQRRHERNLSLLFVDIDNFKRINDSYGHPVGDRVLREVGRILSANLRKIDYVFRYGGDEFVVLMTETDSQRAAMLAQRIRAAVKRETCGICPSGAPVSISVGVADCSALSRIEREELLFRADEALYMAKSAGRDRVRVAAPPVDCAVGVN